MPVYDVKLPEGIDGYSHYASNVKKTEGRVTAKSKKHALSTSLHWDENICPYSKSYVNLLKPDVDLYVTEVKEAKKPFEEPTIRFIKQEDPQLKLGLDMKNYSLLNEMSRDEYLRKVFRGEILL